MDQLERVARSEVGALLRDLPPEIRREAVCIPVSYESYPSEKLKRDGVLMNTLGLLVGGNRNEEAVGLITVPVQIILFLGNLCDEVDGRMRDFREEVRITYLHELGHYLGFEEDEIEARGLS